MTNLTKRPDGLPLLKLHCEVCNGPVDGYTVSDIANPPHKMAFNAYCHGSSIRWDISDVEGFWEAMAVYRGEDAAPMSLFHKPTPAPNLDPHGNMEIHDGPSQ